MTEEPVLVKIKEALEAEKPARSVELTDDELKAIKGLHLLTIKPMLYVANVSEDEVADPSENKYVKLVQEYAAAEGAQVITICAKIEEEISELEDEEKKEFLNELGIAESGLDQLIKASYSLLGLATYFTAGVQEVRAWTFLKGMKAPQCAGIIHTDFERGFIRAETVAFDDLVEYGSKSAAKEAGRVRAEGKEYVVQDGDVLEFLFNV